VDVTLGSKEAVRRASAVDVEPTSGRSFFKGLTKLVI
jgi:hypothetical protein